MSTEHTESARPRRAIPLISGAIAVAVVAGLLYLRAGSPTGIPGNSRVPAPIPRMSGSYSANFDFLDPVHGWAIVLGYGESNSFWIFETKDAAAHWRQSFGGHLPSDYDYFRFGTPYVHFFDSRHGIAYAGQLLRTVDGGAHWEVVEASSGQGFLTLTSAYRGWSIRFAEGNARLYATEDGGKAWTAVSGQLPSGFVVDAIGTPNQLAFRDTGEGWLGSSQEVPVVYVTIDGGVSWRAIRLPAQDGIAEYGTNVRLLPGDGVLVIVYAPFGAFYASLSLDHGATWRYVEFPPSPATLSDVSFVDSSHWWASRFGYVFQTVDAGRTWTQNPRADLPAGWNIQPAHVIDARHAWWSMVSTTDSRETALMLTSDGGASWRAVNLPSPA